MKRHKFLVSYDICNPRRLYRVAKICESFGTRLQFSVFECSLCPLLLAKLRTELNAVIHHDDDQILIVNLGLDSSSNPITIDSMGLPYTIKSRVTII